MSRVFVTLDCGCAFLEDGSRSWCPTCEAGGPRAPRLFFPVMDARGRCPSKVPWYWLNEDHAQRIHGQTLERLAERGGLSPAEILLNMSRGKLSDWIGFDEPAANIIAAALKERP